MIAAHDMYDFVEQVAFDAEFPTEHIVRHVITQCIVLWVPMTAVCSEASHAIDQMQWSHATDCADCMMKHADQR